MLAAALPAFTFSVALLPAVRDVGVTEALAPLGVPDTARLIVPPVPTTVVEMVLEPLAPCTRLKLVGLAEIVKFGLGAVTVSCTVVVWRPPPSAPFPVTVYVPAAALAAFTFSVALLPAVTDPGLSEALAPLGTPETARLTVPAVPLVNAVEMLIGPLAPCARLRLVGLAEIEKSLPADAGQPGSLNEAIRVCQLNAPSLGMYSFVYQNVQSSLGSMAIAL